MHRIMLPLVAAASLAAPGEAPPEPLPPAYQPCRGTVPVFNPEGCPVPGIALDRDESMDEAPCRDRIRQIRAAGGQPRLESLPASPERPYMIAAVDKRIDGCAVMQMHGDVNDLRPLPPASRAPELMHRAN